MSDITKALLILVVLQPVAGYSENNLSLPQTEVVVTAHDGIELNLYQYPAQGEYIIIWIGSSYGLNDRTTQAALEFAQQGIEVWQIDFAEVLFQTNSSNFMRNLDARYVADIIDAAYAQTGKHVILLARAYGAIPTLRGAMLWQQRAQHNSKLLGAILFSPDLFTAIPPLGEDPVYLPISRQTDLPLLILQGGRRSSTSQLPRLLEELTSHNPNVYFGLMPDISGVFYSGDPNPESLTKLNSLSNEIKGYIKLLEATPYTVTTKSYVQPRQRSKAILDIKLQPFKGKTTPFAFALSDIHGQPFVKDKFHGKVTLVNFWATWCPPCVEEIPSLNRLRAKMKGKPFELISINHAETPEIVSNFMHSVRVDFPVLMDLNGEVSKQWNVIAFPSTFVIGKDGRIQYGINAAIRWDTPEVVEQLELLSK